jgi:Flp pilus assembly protein TadG
MKSTLTRRRALNGQKGAAMLETALVLLTLLFMVIFIMDMGRILLMQQYITERARATVRNAVVNNWDATKTKNFLVYNSTTAPNGSPAGFMGLQTTQVSYQTLGTAGASDYRLQVKVSNVPALVFIPHIAGTYTLAPIVATLPAQSLGSTN